LNQTGDSLYLVYAGYQDYFFSLYNSILTPRQALDIVPDVVKAISDHIEVSGIICITRGENLMSLCAGFRI
jgi:hypothetical protein